MCRMITPLDEALVRAYAPDNKWTRLAPVDSWQLVASAADDLIVMIYFKSYGRTPGGFGARAETLSWDPSRLTSERVVVDRDLQKVLPVPDHRHGDEFFEEYVRSRARELRLAAIRRKNARRNDGS